MAEVTVSFKSIPFAQAHTFHYEIQFRMPAPTFHKAQNVSHDFNKFELYTVKDQKL